MRSRPSSPEPQSLFERRLALEIERLRAQDLYRQRRAVQGRHGVEMEVDGRRCVNFCSNDYLGLAGDPRVAAAAKKALDRCGTGSGAAALISGYNVEHRRLEEALAAFVQRPRVLLFSSGWAANLGVLKALLSKGDVLIADELNHASLIDGGRLSGAQYVRVPHADVRAFEAALQRESGIGNRESERQVLLVSDAVFSMDGDLADVPALTVLCAKYQASLMLDDAHGFGVLGPRGRGTVEYFSTIPDSRFPVPDIYVATLGKSLGVFGAFVAGSEALIEYLIQRARSWVFSTAPPPALAAAAFASLQILQAEPQRRERLLANIGRFRQGAAQLGITLGSSPVSRLPSSVLTPIQPLILGEERRALSLSSYLFQRGYWVGAIRPPTVPKGTARLRITLSAAHTGAQIEGLLAALDSGLRELAEAA